MMRWNKVLLLSLICIISSVSAVVPFNANILTSPLSIGLKQGDILMYNVSIQGSPRFQKFVVTNITKNDSALSVDFDNFATNSISDFNETTDVNMTRVLTGNLTQDLFSEFTFFNLLLLEHTNFSQSDGDIQDLIDDFNREADLNIKYSIGISGLSISIKIYVRILVLVKILELKAFYSSSRILLRADYWARDLKSLDVFEGNYIILPEYSTADGVDQNPYNPLNVELSSGDNTSLSSDTATTSNDSTDSSTQDHLSEGNEFIWDLKAVLILVGVGTTGILGSGGIILFLRKKKIKAS